MHLALFLTGTRPELFGDRRGTPLSPRLLGQDCPSHTVLGRGTSDPVRCSTPELHGHKFRGRIRTCDHPLTRRSNRSLHHRPEIFTFCALLTSLLCSAERCSARLIRVPRTARSLRAGLTRAPVPTWSLQNSGQGTSAHGSAFAHGESNPTARRRFRQRSIRDQTPLTLRSLDFSRRAPLGRTGEGARPRTVLG